MTAQSPDLPDQATICLVCACENRENGSASSLLTRTGAQSATGVIAAIFLAPREERWILTEHARCAVGLQREWCDRHGPFDPHRCTVERLKKRSGTPA